MLQFIYLSNEELIKSINNGALQEEIIRYFNELTEDDEDLNDETVFDYFEAQVGDEYIGYQCINNPVDPVSMLIHNAVKNVYERFKNEKRAGEHHTNDRTGTTMILLKIFNYLKNGVDFDYSKENGFTVKIPHDEYEGLVEVIQELNGIQKFKIDAVIRNQDIEISNFERILKNLDSNLDVKGFYDELVMELC